MTERPILFAGRLVRAILEGGKTQTRRVVKPQPRFAQTLRNGSHEASADGGFDQDLKTLRCPHGAPGDRLWVRETWKENVPPSGWIYRATDESSIDPRDARPWRPSIFMPRAASRLLLEVLDVRVAQLQDIIEADAIAEGVPREKLPPDPDNFHPPGSYGFVSGLHPFPEGRIYPTAREAFAEGWDALNGKRAPWTSNPWVWAIAFRRADP